MRASQRAEENILISEGYELTRFAHSGLKLFYFFKVTIVTSIDLFNYVLGCFCVVFVRCLCMAINVSVQHNGGFSPILCC